MKDFKLGYKLGNDYELTSELIWKIKNEIQFIITKYNDIGKNNWTPLTLITGMALGIDTLFAKIAIENNIPFIAAIPCIGQENRWLEKSQRLYFELIENPLCEKVLISNCEYNNNCMQLRNKWMVDNSDLLISVWNHSPGGTKNCINYAESIGKQMININPNDFK